jgi:hypothetical protein
MLAEFVTGARTLPQERLVRRRRAAMVLSRLSILLGVTSPYLFLPRAGLSPTANTVFPCGFCGGGGGVFDAVKSSTDGRVGSSALPHA